MNLDFTVHRFSKDVVHDAPTTQECRFAILIALVLMLGLDS